MLQLNKKGFTLIELLVVIAIIGVLGSIVFAPFNEARKKGRDGKRIAELKGVQSTLLLFSEDSSGCFPDSAAAAAAANSLDYLSYKYISKTLHDKIKGYNTAGTVAGVTTLNKWTTNAPYMFRSVGDDAQCSKTTGALAYFPNYQLMVELETHTTGLDGDGDVNLTPAAFSNGTGKKGGAGAANTSYDGLDNTSAATAVETCLAFAAGSFQCVFDLSNQ